MLAYAVCCNPVKFVIFTLIVSPLGPALTLKPVGQEKSTLGFAELKNFVVKAPDTVFLSNSTLQGPAEADALIE
jgi:hypothetical protein